MRCWPIALGLLGLALAACTERYTGPYRHVVLITLDTTRADHLGAYGSERARTPHLDRVAAQGVVFRNAVAAAPTTLASHTSIMTGTYPHTHGVPRNGFVIDDRNEMLAEILAREGFHTAAFLGSFALDSRFGFGQGFAWFDERFDVGVKPGAYDQDQRRAERVTDAVLEHLDDLGGGERRLFLFVHYFDPHAPYDPPPPYDRLYGRPGGLRSSSVKDARAAAAAHYQRLGVAGPGRAADVGLAATAIEKADGQPLGRDRDLAALYAGEVTYMDAHIGRLLTGLEDRGILDEALLVVTADHGETFWEHGDFWNHGLWVYDTTVAVPLIFQLSRGLRQPRSVETPVSGIDLLPTLLDLLEIARPPRVEGVSLEPALSGEAFERGPVFSEATQPWRDLAPGVRWPNAENASGVRRGRWKYVAAPYLDDLEELYELDADPGERRNRVRASDGTAPAEREALRALLDAWQAEADPLPMRFNAEQAEEVWERLEALGYIRPSRPKR